MGEKLGKAKPSASDESAPGSARRDGVVAGTARGNKSPESAVVGIELAAPVR